MAYAPTRLAGAKPIGGDRQPRTPLDSYYTAAPVVSPERQQRALQAAGAQGKVRRDKALTPLSNLWHYGLDGAGMLPRIESATYGPYAPPPPLGTMGNFSPRPMGGQQGYSPSLDTREGFGARPPLGLPGGLGAEAPSGQGYYQRSGVGQHALSMYSPQSSGQHQASPSDVPAPVGGVNKYGFNAADGPVLRANAARAQAGQYTDPYERDPSIGGMANFQAKNIYDKRNFNQAYTTAMGAAMQAGTPGMGLMSNEQAGALGGGKYMPNVTVGGAYGRGPAGPTTDLLNARLGLNGQGGTVPGGETDPGTLGALRGMQKAPWMNGQPNAVTAAAGAGSQGAGIWSTRTSSKSQADRQKLVEQNAVLRGSQRKDRLAARKAVPTVMDMLAQQDPETYLAAMQLQQNGLFQQGQLANDAAKTGLLKDDLAQRRTEAGNQFAVQMQTLKNAQDQHMAEFGTRNKQLDAQMAQAQQQFDLHSQQSKQQFEAGEKSADRRFSAAEKSDQRRFDAAQGEEQQKTAAQMLEAAKAIGADDPELGAAITKHAMSKLGMPAQAAAAPNAMSAAQASGGLRRGTQTQETAMASMNPTQKRDYMRNVLKWTDDEISARLAEGFDNTGVSSHVRSLFTATKAMPPSAKYPEGYTEGSPGFPGMIWNVPGNARAGYNWLTGSGK